MSIKWRHQYDIAADERERAATQVGNFGPTKTVQSFTEDSDINVLVRRFGITDGAIPPAAADPRFYGDFTDAPDFRQALDATRAAQQRFSELPADLRKRFGHDPVELWQFVNDEKNAEEAIKLGLLKRSQPTPTAPPADPPAQ